MLRGINRQNIFEEDEDRLFFMNTLAHCKKISEFRLYAFVLMSNHIHLLIEPVKEPLDMIFRRIGTRYAVWYNHKYQRVGHLFQDRFRSENVETDLYFMTVLRYILQNPMKAGLEAHPGIYRWSSYPAYINGKGTVTDTQFAMDLSGGREELAQFLAQDNEDAVMDESSFDRRLQANLAKEKMVQITQCSSVSDFQQLDPSLQKEYVRKMHLEGLSLGQISRMTGTSKTTVYRTVNAYTDPIFKEAMLFHESGPDPTAYLTDADVVW